MKRILKWIGIGLGGILAIAFVAILALYLIGGARVNRDYEISPQTVAIPSESTSIERGRHLAEAIVGCKGCHGDDLAGKDFFDEGGIATIYAPNLTPGEGGIGAIYTDEDWVRAIRHGARPNGEGFLIMPSDGFANLSADDLGSLIAYVQSVPPVDKTVPERSTGLMGRILVALGAFGEIVPAQLIDHEAPIPAGLQADDSAEYGGYLVSVAGCGACHGEDLAGDQPGDPDSPRAPAINGSGPMGSWSADEFAGTIRTGVTPGGNQLDAEFMPWDEYGRMTDGELRAVWRFLKNQ